MSGLQKKDSHDMRAVFQEPLLSSRAFYSCSTAVWFSSCRAKGITCSTAACYSSQDNLCPTASHGLICKSSPVSFHSKQDFLCEIDFFFLVKSLTEKQNRGNRLFYCFGQSFLFQFHFSLVTRKTVFTGIFKVEKSSYEK